MSDLKDMPQQPRLVLRGKFYYYRAVVPKDIRGTYEKTEELASLRTSDLALAKRRFLIKDLEVQEKFDSHRRKLKANAAPPLAELTKQQLDHIKACYVSHLLDEDEEVRLEGFDEFVDIQEERVWVSDRPDLPRDTFEEHQEGQEFFSQTTKADYARGRFDEFIIGEAEDVLEWDNVCLRLHPNSPSWSKLYRALQEAIIGATGAIKERDRGEVVETPDMPSKATSAVNTASRFPLMSTAAKEFVNERARTNWTEKTKRDYEAQLRNFIEAVGDLPLDRYSKKEGRKFKSIVERLPANWNKLKPIKNKTISEAADRAEQLGLTPMNVATANKVMGRVSYFFNWADQNYFDEQGPAPLQGMNFKDHQSQREKRDPFSVSQLQRNFSAPIYTGFKSDRKWGDAGQMIDPESSRFWAPLITLFSGARETEIFCLTVNDFIVDDSITAMSINDDGEGKKLKNKAARRIIPVHKELIRLGLLKLVEDRKSAGHHRLFYDCADKEPARASDNFSKWYSRFLEKCGTKSERLVFHSFRHNVQDAYLRGQIPDQLVCALQGHTETGMKAVYGSGAYPIKALDQAIQSIEYPGLDLTNIQGYGIK